MKEPEFTFRDLLAAPFFILGLFFHYISVSIGSMWTSWVTLKIIGLRD